MKEPRNHLFKYLGDTGAVVCTNKSTGIQVIEFVERDLDHAKTYCTCGMSVRPQHQEFKANYYGDERDEDVSLHTEILCYFEGEDVQHALSALVALAEYPFQNETNFSWGHTIAYGGPVLPQTALDCFMFLPPFFEEPEFGSFLMRGHRIDILMAVPISTAERRYCIDRGSLALCDLLFDKHAIWPGDWRRQSVV